VSIYSCRNSAPVPPWIPLHHHQSRIPESPQRCPIYVVSPDWHLASMVLPTSLSLPSVSCSPGSRQVPKPTTTSSSFFHCFSTFLSLSDIHTLPYCFFPSDSTFNYLLYSLYQSSRHTVKQQLTQGGYLKNPVSAGSSTG